VKNKKKGEGMSHDSSLIVELKMIKQHVEVPYYEIQQKGVG